MGPRVLRRDRGYRAVTEPGPWPFSKVNERLLILGALTESNWLCGNPVLRRSQGPAPVITQGPAFRGGQHLAQDQKRGFCDTYCNYSHSL